MTWYVVVVHRWRNHGHEVVSPEFKTEAEAQTWKTERELRYPHIVYDVREKPSLFDWLRN